jgi:mono/diheme cytochrome c family protein
MDFAQRSHSPAISQWPVWGYLPVTIALCAVWIQSIASAQSSGDLSLRTGKEIWDAGCVTCHGPDGKGQPQTILGFEPPASFPDFTDCPTATPELDIQWKAIVTDGGPARGFSEIMPSFREFLTPNQIDMVIGYMRTFCKDSSWPRAEMNLPRPLYTEKAYPENETVLTNSVDAAKNGAATSTVIYEKRFGSRNNLELVLPFNFVQNPASNQWYGGVGDVTVEFKRAVYSNRRTGSLLTAAGEWHIPTGDKARGLGDGVTVFEPFVSYAQLLPRRSFVQFQSGVEFPTHTDDRPREAFWRTAAGKSFSPDGGLGRTWSPMLELLGMREYESGAKVEWDVAPQVQVTLSKRQHIRANFGVRIPVNNFNNRAVQIGFYLLWDWLDGGIREGWR